MARQVLQGLPESYFEAGFGYFSKIWLHSLPERFWLFFVVEILASKPAQEVLVIFRTFFPCY